MQYAILVYQHPNGDYQASVPVIPGLTRVGGSRDVVLQTIREAIIATLQQSEVVYMDIPEKTAVHNPWLATAGVFADDPTLEPMLAEIYKQHDFNQISGLRVEDWQNS